MNLAGDLVSVINWARRLRFHFLFGHLRKAGLPVHGLPCFRSGRGVSECSLQVWEEMEGLVQRDGPGEHNGT